MMLSLSSSTWELDNNTTPSNSVPCFALFTSTSSPLFLHRGSSCTLFHFPIPFSSTFSCRRSCREAVRLTENCCTLSILSFLLPHISPSPPTLISFPCSPFEFICGSFDYQISDEEAAVLPKERRVVEHEHTLLLLNDVSLITFPYSSSSSFHFSFLSSSSSSSSSFLGIRIGSLLV